MDDTKLHLGLRIDRLNSLRKAFESLITGHQNILKTPIFEGSEDFEPEFGPFAFSFANPKAQQVLVALAVEAEYDIDGALTNPSSDFDVDVESIAIGNGIQFV